MSDNLRQQINDIIQADIQIGINDYIENEGAGEKGQKLNAKIDQREVNKIIKESTALRKKMADLEEKFLLESGEILDPNQQAKLGLFKHKMMKNMKGKMKKRQKRRGMKDGKKAKRGKKHGKRRGYWN